MASAKVREAQMEDEGVSWLRILIEDPKVIAIVCLRACRHHTDMNQTTRLRFNVYSEYPNQLARFGRTSNLSNEGSHTFAAASASRIMFPRRQQSLRSRTFSIPPSTTGTDHVLRATIAAGIKEMNGYRGPIARKNSPRRDLTDSICLQIYLGFRVRLVSTG
jgi:hypothetical protein